jgi:hypothetical protein
MAVVGTSVVVEGADFTPHQEPQHRRLGLLAAAAIRAAVIRAVIALLCRRRATADI